MKNTKFIALLFSTILFLTGCEHKTASPATEVVTAQLQDASTHIYYNGVLQPAHSYAVAAPVDGLISQMYFAFGSPVQKGQLLFTITSTKAQRDYTAALTDLLKSKDQFLRSKNSFDADSALYQVGVIAKEEYLTEKSQLAVNQLAYINAKSAFTATAEHVPDAIKNPDTLSLDDLASIQQILEKKYDRLHVMAPSSGIALSSKQNNNGDNEGMDQAITVGSEVKQNQALVTIGDTNDIACVIQVSENDINQLTTGQKATVTLSALSDLALSGQVEEISQQAQTTVGNSGSANFPVKIVVKDLTPQQRQLIRIGMNAKVDILLNQPLRIKIPLQAVFMRDGQSMVTLVTANGQHRDITVQTGTTDLSQVVILQGLRVGDKVLMPK